MKKVLLLSAAVLFSSPAHSQDAITILKSNIGAMMIESANLAGQLNAVTAENAKLKAELEKLKADQKKPEEQKPADSK